MGLLGWITNLGMGGSPSGVQALPIPEEAEIATEETVAALSSFTIGRQYPVPIHGNIHSLQEVRKVLMAVAVRFGITATDLELAEDYIKLLSDQVQGIAEVAVGGYYLLETGTDYMLAETGGRLPIEGGTLLTQAQAVRSSLLTETGDRLLDEDSERIFLEVNAGSLYTPLGRHPLP